MYEVCGLGEVLFSLGLDLSVGGCGLMQLAEMVDVETL